jgi:NADH-quinone oxidoreductase subunit G
MSASTIKIEVDGAEVEAQPGQMLIAVTDASGVYIPRFCYHDKLSIAANCRMCLVEVENAPKPLPACATPVTEGMKVFTKSPKAISAQKATMEFLLINHPLDCPICDQGGECELQDLAMGYGRDISRYTERKRVVKDKNLGPLVSTDMTRCIHCTRCVRFGQEIAGIQELGTIGRGERTEISTYIEQSVDHELSGNIIDLCPVGALNNKPYRFSARAWEMTEQPGISPHDCVGSNLGIHVLDGRVMRVVPRVNEELNETWLSDRDRFSYEGIYAADRLPRPMIREDGVLRDGSWEEALQAAATGLRTRAPEVGALVSPSATTEEAYLAGLLLRHLGSDNIDHRLRRRDFRLQESDPLFPWLGTSVAAVEECDAILVVGSNLRSEAPLLAHRVRKAALAGASVRFIDRDRYEYLFQVADYLTTSDLVSELATAVKACGESGTVSSGAKSVSGQADSPREEHDRLAKGLSEGASSMILLGHISQRDPRFAEIQLLAAELARLTGAALGYLGEGANSAGASLAGALPHRGIGGRAVEKAGAHAGKMLAEPPAGLLLLGVEPEHDFADGDAALRALGRAEFVVALTAFRGAGLEQHADVLLPVGTFAETSGTFVNGAGDWQSFAGAVRPLGEARPAWKVLRVLGNLTDLSGCDYASSEEIRDELKAAVHGRGPDNSMTLNSALEPYDAPQVDSNALDVNMHQIDPLVRRAESLQKTKDALRHAPERSRRRKSA